MTKYGTDKYSNFKYGLSATDNLLWAMEIDWDDDGIFDGQNEAMWAFYFQSTRGREFYIRPSADGFEVMPKGEAVIRLYNDTGRYDPFNAASPLYGMLSPGKKVRIQVKNGTAGENYPVFTGRLADITPYGRRGIVDLDISDGWDFLHNASPYVAIQTNITADDGIGAILDDINWPAIWGRSLDVGPDNIKYWWASKQNAKIAIEDLASSGMGYVFTARNGAFTYYSRHRIADPVMTLTEDELLKDIAIPQPWEFQRNIINVQANPRVEQALQVIWTLQEEKPLIGPGESYTVYPQYSYNDISVPAIDVVDPLLGTDYTFNAQEDDGGAAVANTRTYDDFGETGKLTILNTDIVSGYLTLAQVRGKPLEKPDVAGMRATGSGYLTDPKVFNLNLPWLQDTNTARDFTDFLAGFLSTSPIFPQGFIEDRPTIQFDLELFDDVTLDLATWGINDVFRLSKITHKWLNKSGQLVSTQLGFEPSFAVAADSVWILGVSLLGVGTIMTW
ncbi:MAG TPA: hypothetical protein VMW53_07495 [archaeon]|nr:hypothetical protein [archaeon]